MTDHLTPEQIAATGKALLGDIYLNTLRVIAEQLRTTAASDISAATLQAALKLLDQNNISLVAMADASSPLTEKPDYAARFGNMPDFTDLSAYDDAGPAPVSPASAPFEQPTFTPNGLIRRPYHAAQDRLQADPADTVTWD
jgi:hypothetical protein